MVVVTELEQMAELELGVLVEGWKIGLLITQQEHQDLAMSSV
jgi:hypothetical protein